MGKSYRIAAALALCTSISAARVDAATPFTAGKTQLGGTVSFGFAPGEKLDSINPYGLGLGLDAGYTFGMGLHLGGEFNYFFGTSDKKSGTEVSANAVQYGVELGYDLGLDSDLVLRPKVGIGSVTIHENANSSDSVGGHTESGLFLPVGAALLISLGGGFIGGDFRYGFSLDDDLKASGALFGICAGAAF